MSSDYNCVNERDQMREKVDEYNRAEYFKKFIDSEMELPATAPDRIGKLPRAVTISGRAEPWTMEDFAEEVTGKNPLGDLREKSQAVLDSNPGMSLSVFLFIMLRNLALPPRGNRKTALMNELKATYERNVSPDEPDGTK